MVTQILIIHSNGKLQDSCMTTTDGGGPGGGLEGGLEGELEGGQEGRLEGRL